MPKIKKLNPNNDPMIGAGTTAIECKLLNKNLLALDINPNAIEIINDALDFESDFDKLVTNRLKGKN